MSDQRKEHQLEELLDRLLSGYSAIAPRPGLESRILASVRAQRQRRQSWMFVSAAATAAVILVGLVMDWRASNPASSHESAKIPAVSPMGRRSQQTASSSSLRTARNPNPVRSKDRSNRPNLLKIVDAMHGEDRLVFKEEKLYLQPAPDPEAAPVAEQQAAASDISIKDLEVQPIAIKGLVAEKEPDEKGKL